MTANATVVPVTPDLAREWLTKNQRNRPINHTTVQKYRRDMLNGRWLYAADPIRFSDTGMLLDGQHRLTALAELEGTTIPMLVVNGLAAESQMVMDQGRRRLAGQQLTMLGYKNGNVLAAGIKLLLIHDQGYLFRDNKAAGAAVTTADIEAFAASNGDAIDRLHAYFAPRNNTDLPNSVAWTAAFMFDRIDPDSAREFFVHLAEGGMPVDHPINTLDKRLARLRREGLKQSTRDTLALTIQAWNAWRSGREVKKFIPPRGGWSEANYPTPC